MKKILAFILCAMLIFALPVVAFAEGESVDGIVQEEVAEGNSTTTEENATEGEISASEPLLSETIKEWILAHIEEILVVIFGAVSTILSKRYYAKSNLSMGTMNNNAVAIAKNSSTALDDARLMMERAAETVLRYDTKITELLAAFKVTAEEKQKLEEELTEVKNALKGAMAANLEVANEFAELLCLANIPNSKKEELYSRHRAAVDKIAEAENTEVKENDGAEA